jgi:hypothetical protein
VLIRKNDIKVLSDNIRKIIDGQEIDLRDNEGFARKEIPLKGEIDVLPRICQSS